MPRVLHRTLHTCGLARCCCILSHTMIDASGKHAQKCCFGNTNCRPHSLTHVVSSIFPLYIALIVLAALSTGFTKARTMTTMRTSVAPQQQQRAAAATKRLISAVCRRPDPCSVEVYHLMGRATLATTTPHIHLTWTMINQVGATRLACTNLCALTRGSRDSPRTVLARSFCLFQN